MPRFCLCFFQLTRLEEAEYRDYPCLILSKRIQLPPIQEGRKNLSTHTGFWPNNESTTRKPSMLNWSLISLLDLMAFLFIQYTASRKGFPVCQQSLISWSVLILSSLTLLSHAVFHIVLAIEGDQWSTADAQWAQLIGFVRVQSWRTLPSEYFLVIQVLATFLSIIEIYGNGFGQNAWRDFHSGHPCSSVLLIGSHLKGVCYLLLPAIQLITGISHIRTIGHQNKIRIIKSK
ncbi:Piezo-type mechanosensitive ion channel-like [Spatholobus suberectus]|nr:Piezo-type mechanosensitive ion channel-like [Spatholobus suberectus]